MKIDELTDKEILALSEEDIVLMIKLAKAEAGIKLVAMPTEPWYIKIPAPNEVVYMCGLFGESLCFNNVSDAEDIIDFIGKKSVRAIDHNYNDGGNLYRAQEISSKLYGKEWNVIESKKVYSKELYSEITDAIKVNRDLKSDYEKELKIYKASIEESREIVTKIRSKVSDVLAEHYRLQDLCKKMKNDYMPLAGGTETIAMNFLTKAYSLTSEDIEYVLSNYEEML